MSAEIGITGQGTESKRQASVLAWKKRKKPDRKVFIFYFNFTFKELLNKAVSHELLPDDIWYCLKLTCYKCPKNALKKQHCQTFDRIFKLNLLNFPLRPFLLGRFPWSYASFRPETALFRCSGVNLRTCLCGVTVYASAQLFDFLATTQNFSFPI